MRVIVFSLTLLISSTVMAQNYGRSNGWTNGPDYSAWRRANAAALNNPYWGAWYLPEDVVRKAEAMSWTRANDAYYRQQQQQMQRSNRYQQQRGGLYGTGGYGSYRGYR